MQDHMQPRIGRKTETPGAAAPAGQDALRDLCDAVGAVTGAEACCIVVAPPPGPENRGAGEIACSAEGRAALEITAMARQVLSGQRAAQPAVAAGRIATLLVPTGGGPGAAVVAAVFPAGSVGPGLEAVRGLVTLFLRESEARRLAEGEIRELRADCAALRVRAESDAMTGMKNSSAFHDHAASRLAQGGYHALLLFDIDHFKRVNDLYGHSFGDDYLRRIAVTIRDAMPPDALTGRIGGDEFAALVRLPTRWRDFLDDLLARCSSAVQRTAALMGKPELGRISAGISVHPWHARDFDDLFDLADAALYVSKRAGRSTATVFDPARHDRFSKRILDERFWRATRQNRIVPYFQPIVDLTDGQCFGYEVLARWIDDNGRVLNPTQFEHVFGDYRLADSLTRTLLSASLDLLAERIVAEGGAGPALSINLTAFDLVNPEFVFDLQAALSDRGLGWSSLILEVTEKVILGDRNGQIYRSLSELRARGVRLAFDDFGTGHGGLRHLRDWPVDILKIDRGFVAHLAGNASDSVIVEAILNIAARCGMRVIAEGVETPEQLALLQELGCHYAQGYFFDGPMPPVALPGARRRYDLGTGVTASALRQG
ncbi:bifunctional diguanylate cyclase/phosphodiesterase [Salipiger sp. H15]|uniref:Bifunctional diguanylate cyclase/phosphodiesterase n=1 Tax=Alloyangia sp. H15 TaxID=3029062 RepID=A0AAU8AGM6_9RHOB